MINNHINNYKKEGVKNMMITYQNKENKKATLVIGSKTYVKINNNFIEFPTEQEAEEYLQDNGYE